MSEYSKQELGDEVESDIEDPADTEIYEPNEQPLTRDEVIELLDTETNISAIGVRLIKAIPGMIMPQPVKGPVADKIDEVYRLLNEKRNNLREPETVEEVMEIIS